MKEKLQPAIRYNRRTGYIIKDAKEPLIFEITQKDIDKAVCKDPSKCVIAQALKRSMALVEGFQIGPNISKLFSESSKIIIRYSTPGKLAAALKCFDTTKIWPLEPGYYRLLALTSRYRRVNRWYLKKKEKKGKQSTFKGTIVAPTRYAHTVCQIGRKEKSK